MAIRNFITLAESFHASVKNGNTNLFLGRRIEQIYSGLPPEDRLRIHGIIDHTDYLQNPPHGFRYQTREEILDILEGVYDKMLECDLATTIRVFNQGRLSNAVSYAKLKFHGCKETYIALDLGDVLHEKYKPADPPPPRPV